MKNTTMTFSLARPLFLGLVMAILVTAYTAQATIIFDWAQVGDAGNNPDTTGRGAVSYEYYMADKMVSNDQYADFLNAVAQSDPNALWEASMNVAVSGGISRSGTDGSYVYTVKSNFGNKPVNYISWYRAARFVNWMENGQGTGSTESGVYNLTLSPGDITRNPSATYFLPSNDEWYKAAYYDPTPGAGNASNYWLYATRTLDGERPLMAEVDSAGNIINPGFRIVNYGGGESNNWNGSTSGNVTTLGSGGPDSASYYATYDQNGNLIEWTETLSGSQFGTMGGYYASGNHVPLRSTTAPVYRDPTEGGEARGFRIASAIPEPSALMLIVTGIGFLMMQRRVKFFKR